MKKTVIIAMALTLAMAAGVKAQDTVATGYRSFFGSESTEWFVPEWLHDAIVVTWDYKIGGDSIVDGESYKCVRKYWLDIFDTTDMVGLEYEENSNAFVREDRVTGRLWYKSGTEEMLLVDMSLQEGDVFSGHQVLSVEHDSLGRKRIVLDNSMFFLEGVGPQYLFGNSLSPMICAFHDGEKKYESSVYEYRSWPINYAYCRVIFDPSGVEEVKGDSPKLSPNPCFSYISMELPEEAQVTVYDALGHLQCSKKCGVGKATIDMSALPAGVYYISTAYSDRMHWSKIIKQ